MLKSLKLSGVGPAPEMQVDFAPRINVLTGDNGLGKSFILEVAWWALAQKWAGLPAWPRPEARRAGLEVFWRNEDRSLYDFSFEKQQWQEYENALTRYRSLVIFVRIDGGFSVWDPFKGMPSSEMSRPRGVETAVFNFDNRQVWEGLRIGDFSVCEGIERDWVSWQTGRTAEFDQMVRVLETLSPPDEILKPGKAVRVFLGESFSRPTIETATGLVPVAFASSGVRRILALAYMLVWTMAEHRIAARLTRRSPLDKIVVLFDEPETHLHPKWQRTILPSVVAAVSQLSGIELQLITATHSPLVLASLEPTFDPAKDQLIDLHLEGSELMVNQVQWRRRGDASAWLTSEIFDLKSARSVEAEQALEQAAEVLGEEPPNPARAKALDQRLRGLLGESDPFWIRWRYLGEKQGWLE